MGFRHEKLEFEWILNGILESDWDGLISVKGGDPSPETDHKDRVEDRERIKLIFVWKGQDQS